jgi:glycosyltransferase involved in cell wall biosynthesis
VHLSNKEKTEEKLIEQIYGISKYWVIAPGGKRDCTTKIWDWRRFQEVIDYFDGRIKFVTIGRSDHLVEKLNGVIDLTDKFNDNLRSIWPLVYHSEGVVSGVSFLMHLAAGMKSKDHKHRKARKPCVAIYGGREPTTFTCYTNHQILHTNGAFDCCDNGGCWQSRVTPLQKDPDKNTRMCHNTVVKGGRTIQSCMDTITANDVIRAIEKYYEGNIYKPLPSNKPLQEVEVIQAAPVEINSTGKEINILASLKSKGGGEQSALKIAEVLKDAGWKVNLYPWGKVHKNYSNFKIESTSFFNETKPHSNFFKSFKPGLPLLFYANDQIWDFVLHGKELIDASSSVIVGINYCNGTLPKYKYLSQSKKLKAIVFQNEEKKNEFCRDQIGFDDTRLISLFGAIELDKFLEVVPASRNSSKDNLVVLKHCTPDYRKYITAESEGTGEKIHIWQKHIFKERDTRFYSRMLKDVKGVVFEFMEAHEELVNHFKNEPRMIFHKWDSMPVTEFLSRGHVYLYRTSNKWRDQYPRGVAEALAVGLPVLTEPRDGTRDRVDNGNTGLHCIDYDGFLYAVKILKRKEDMRKSMGMNAKDWARANLDPKLWVSTIEEVLYGERLNEGCRSIRSP